MKYRKIPIISPGAYFWSKGHFEKFFLGELIFGGGGLIHHIHKWRTRVKQWDQVHASEAYEAKKQRKTM